MESEFPELPALIYDGPFSESVMRSSPRFLEGLGMADAADAKGAAARFLSVDESELDDLGEMNGTIPCYCFSCCAGGGEYTVYVTKQGGRILSAICSRLPGRAQLSVEAGLDAADSFLRQQKIEGMERSYHMTEGGVLTVNYEYVQDGAMCYPDLIKVGIALDNGSIVSYDAQGYLSAHRERELPDPAVTLQDALSSVSPALTVRSHRMAVIPSAGGEERFCHELLCRSKDDRNYLVYVNAETGAQEKILILLEDESGTLTI
jgi:germination protein YpeB